MSYTPNKTWKKGDPPPTAVEMNHIEQGVQSINMSYTPKTWVKGEYLLHQDMNHIEQGIADGGGNPNSKITITGTLENPFDAYVLAFLTGQVDGNVSAKVTIDASILGVSDPVYVYPYESGMGEQVTAEWITCYDGTINGMYAHWTATYSTVDSSLTSFALDELYVIQDSELTDLLESADLFPTSTEIYFHTMPSTT